MRFRDREDAGRQLALRLLPYRLERPVVLGLPRGGVPVAYEVARALEAPLDLWVVKKVGAPGFAEFGLGAVAQGGQVYLNPASIREVGVSKEALEESVQRVASEVSAREAKLRRGRPPLDVKGKTVIVVDDGIATGGTARAAIESLRVAGAHRIILATAVAPPRVLNTLEPLTDATVCLSAPEDLYAISAFYEDFHQLTDEDVIEQLERARSFTEPPSVRVGEPEVRIPIPGGELEGVLGLPPDPAGLVLFAHGSGSSRFSPRNRRVAEALQRHGLGTLLFDLLTPEEEQVDEETGELRFDILFLARRLVAATDWASTYRETAGLPLGYFGSSTGAAAALIASVERSKVRAVVSRGGRPDLAMDVLQQVEAPTLFLVGGEDREVLELNRRAYAQLWSPRQLSVIPGATHLFEEAGALEKVAQLAAEWFVRFLPIGISAEQTDAWE